MESPFDDEVLYITTHTGSLMVLSAKDGKILATVNPTPRPLTGNEHVDKFSMFSNSGIQFAETSSGGKFLVYSIVIVYLPEFC